MILRTIADLLFIVQVRQLFGLADSINYSNIYWLKVVAMLKSGFFWHTPCHCLTSKQWYSWCHKAHISAGKVTLSLVYIYFYISWLRWNYSIFIFVLSRHLSMWTFIVKGSVNRSILFYATESLKSLNSLQHYNINLKSFRYWKIFLIQVTRYEMSIFVWVHFQYLGSLMLLALWNSLLRLQHCMSMLN